MDTNRGDARNDRAGPESLRRTTKNASPWGGEGYTSDSCTRSTRMGKLLEIFCRIESPALIACGARDPLGRPGAVACLVCSSVLPFHFTKVLVSYWPSC